MQRRVPNIAFFAILGAALPACDLVQGFRDASDALFPPERTYFDAPGFRIVRGAYRSLDFTAGTDLFLLARSSNKDDAALYSMRYSDPHPCAIPNVGWFRGTIATYRGPALVAYQDRTPPDGGRVLRFADGNCQNYALTIETENLHMLELTNGLVVHTHQGGDLLMVDPVAGTKELIVSQAQSVSLNAFSNLNVVRLDTDPVQFAVFRADWHELGRFGRGVGGIIGVGKNLFYEDMDGVHRLTASGGSSPDLADSILGANACELAAPPHLGGSDVWITFRSPCGASDVPLSGFVDGMTNPIKLPVPAEAQTVALWPTWPAQKGDPTTDPFFFFYQTRDGMLWMRAGAAGPVALGSNPAMDHISVVGSDTGIFGYALVNLEGDTGQFIRFGADGSRLVLGERVLLRSDLILNPDDPVSGVGDFALPSPTGLQPVAKRVPYGYFRLRDSLNRWTAVLHDFDDAQSVATLSVTSSALDFGTAAALTTPSAPPVLTPIAYGVRPDWRTQFVPAVPGLAYLTAYNREQNSGRLDYRNLALGFTATVSDGVSDYISSTDSLIYTVPFGDSAGVWAVRAR